MKHLSIGVECACDEQAQATVEFAASGFDGRADEQEISEIEAKGLQLQEVAQELSAGLSKKGYDSAAELVPALESLVERSSVSSKPGLFGLSVALEAVEQEKVGVVRRALRKIGEYLSRFVAWINERIKAFIGLVKNLAAASTKAVRDTVSRAEQVLRNPGSIVAALRAMLSKEKNKKVSEDKVAQAVEKFVATVGEVTKKINASPVLLYAYHSPQSIDAQLELVREYVERLKGIRDRVMGSINSTKMLLGTKGDISSSLRDADQRVHDLQSGGFTSEEISKATLRLDMYEGKSVNPQDIRLSKFMATTDPVIRRNDGFKDVQSLATAVERMGKESDVALTALVDAIEKSQRNPREMQILNALARSISNLINNGVTNVSKLLSDTMSLTGAILTLHSYGAKTISGASKLMIAEINQSFEDPEARKNARAAMEKMLLVSFGEGGKK